VKVTLLRGDSFQVIPLADEVEAVCADPPYLIDMMGKKWDSPGGREAAHLWHKGWLRGVDHQLSPQGVVKVFSATRTFHRLAVALQEEGFPGISLEAWMYATGFAKSRDFVKLIDRHLGLRGREKDIEQGPGSEEAVVPQSEESARFVGWGHALKPAWEPILVGRRKPTAPVTPPLRVVHVAKKPLEGTLSTNAIKHGTGGLNIDRSRIPNEADRKKPAGANVDRPSPWLGEAYNSGKPFIFNATLKNRVIFNPNGRHPANVLLEHRAGCGKDSGSCEEGCPVRGLAEGFVRSGADPEDHRGVGLFFKQVGGNRETTDE